MKRVRQFKDLRTAKFLLNSRGQSLKQRIERVTNHSIDRDELERKNASNALLMTAVAKLANSSQATFLR